eukprot:scaffold249383_cov79-Cyclotella_meneghiniana.AAC.3
MSVDSVAQLIMRSVRASAFPRIFHGVCMEIDRSAALLASGWSFEKDDSGKGSLPSQKRLKMLPILPWGSIAIVLGLLGAGSAGCTGTGVGLGHLIS